jgi:hypothetical protein
MAIAEVELDSRQRAPLAKILPRDARTRYRVERLPDGTIVLTPVVSLTDRELSLLSDPERVASIRRGVEEAHAGKVVRHEPGDWGRILEELGTDDED